MSYLRYVCLFARSGVQYILCCIFVWFFFMSCVPYVANFSGLSIFDLPLRCSLTFIISNKHEQISKTYCFYGILNIE